MRPGAWVLQQLRQWRLVRGYLFSDVIAGERAVTALQNGVGQSRSAVSSGQSIPEREIERALDEVGPSPIRAPSADVTWPPPLMWHGLGR